MTALLEKLVAIIAPFSCSVCGKEDNILCLQCLASHFPGIDSVCALCGNLTQDYKLCNICSRTSPLQRVWIGTLYKGVPKQLIYKYKFSGARAGHKALAQALDGIVSFLDPHTLIVPVATAPQRIRQRGFDHTALMAQEFAKLRRLEYAPLLARTHNLRQLGANRSERYKQMQGAFTLLRQPIAGRPILLVDDVCTTGATLSAATQALAAAGAKNISAVVVAWQPPK